MALMSAHRTVSLHRHCGFPDDLNLCSSGELDKLRGSLCACVRVRVFKMFYFTASSLVKNQSSLFIRMRLVQKTKTLIRLHGLTSLTAFLFSTISEDSCIFDAAYFIFLSTSSLNIRCLHKLEAFPLFFENVCDFLLAFLHTNPHLKRGLL